MIAFGIFVAIFVGLTAVDYALTRKRTEPVHYHDVGWLNLHAHERWWTK